MRQSRDPDPTTTPRLIARLRKLSSEDWRALAARLDSLRGDHMSVVWRRAGRRANWMATMIPDRGTISRASFAVAEVLGEFRSPGTVAEDRVRHRVFANRMTLGPRRAYVMASADLHDLVAASCPGDRVLLELVLLAAHLVAYRESVADAVVRESYAFLEPVLSFAELTAK